MSSHYKCFSRRAFALGLLAAPAFAYDFGRPATPDEIKLWDIDVRPDGKGLPDGSGTVAQGKQVFSDNCSACHGENGQGGIKDRLAGGQGTLASNMPVKTVGSFWPYATTLFDYIHRAMPYPAPGSLSNDETYAVTAYILSLNGIVCRRTARSTRTVCRRSRCPIATASFRSRNSTRRSCSSKK